MKYLLITLTALVFSLFTVSCEEPLDKTADIPGVKKDSTIQQPRVPIPGQQQPGATQRRANDDQTTVIQQNGDNNSNSVAGYYSGVTAEWYNTAGTTPAKMYADHKELAPIAWKGKRGLRDGAPIATLYQRQIGCTAQNFGLLANAVCRPGWEDIHNEKAKIDIWDASQTFYNLCLLISLGEEMIASINANQNYQIALNSQDHKDLATHLLHLKNLRDRDILIRRDLSEKLLTLKTRLKAEAEATLGNPSHEVDVTKFLTIQDVM